MNHPIPFEQTAEQSAAPEISKAELRTKGCALHRLREAVDGLERKQVAPRGQLAGVLAVAVVCIGDLALSSCCEEGMGSLAYLISLLAMGGGAYLACRLFLKVPRTWAEALDARLADYRPFSREALIELQRQLQEAGYLDTAIVRGWLDSECERHASASKRVYGAPVSQFLQKQI